MLNLLEESWVVGCNLKKREWSLENVSWQRTWHIVQIRNCSLFSVLTASFFFVPKLSIASTVVIQRNVFHSKRKAAVVSI